MAAKKPASFDSLEQIRQAKQARTKPVTVNVDEHTEVTFTMRAVGRAVFRDLVETHPKGDDDVPLAQWNSNTFPPALIAASCVSPPMSEAEAVELWSDPAWSQGELRNLFDAALDVNT